MLKKFVLTGMLFATLAVAPLTIAAQDWNHGYRASNATQVDNRRMQPRTVQIDRDGGRMRVQAGDREQTGREMITRNGNRDFRAYGQHTEWNR